MSLWNWIIFHHNCITRYLSIWCLYKKFLRKSWKNRFSFQIFSLPYLFSSFSDYKFHNFHSTLSKMIRFTITFMILATIACAASYVDFQPCGEWLNFFPKFQISWKNWEYLPSIELKSIRLFFIDNTKPTPQLVEIDACESHDCTLKKGTPYDVKVSFVSPVDADQVFNLTESLACDHGIVCPVFKGGYCRYTHPWTPMEYTGQSMTQFALFDEKQNTLVCFNMPMSQ